jgi:F0F1-type ATP synthase delta subunit
MRSTELQALMHLVLDGEASAEEAAALERQLAASPAARAEFEELRHLFNDLAGMPRRHPPEGLVAAVQAALPVIPSKGQPGDQLSPASRVLAAASGGIDVRGDRPMEQQHQPFAPQRSLPMTQPHPPYSAKRKAWIGAGIALAAVAIVVQFGFDSTPRSEDVAGTVQPAQRYRAQQTGDIKLGDQSMAQLMQNDAFVKMIRDPAIQAMVRDPAFKEAAQLMVREPELARMLAVNAEPARKALNAQVLQALETNAEASFKIRYAAERASDVMASAEAQKRMQSSVELQKRVEYMVDLNKKANSLALDRVEATRWLTLNAEQAQKFAEHAAALEKVAKNTDIAKIAADNAQIERFVKAYEEAARVAPGYAAAALALARNADVMQLAAQNTDLARAVFSNTEAMKILWSSPAAAQLMVNHAAAAQAMLNAPDLSRHVLQNVDAARVAFQAEADRNATR